MPITEDPGRNNREAQGHPCPALPGNHAPELPALAPTQATPLRVLLLEDQALDAELLIKRLAKAGHAFAWTWVRSEAQYREALQQHQDLILSDYRLPSFSGREALGILRERGLDTPFILISGSVTEQETIDAIRLGADDFLQKDQLGRLVAAIEGVLERRRLLEHAQRNEVRLLAFLENSPSLAFIKDTAGHYLHANQRFLLAYGLESAAVLGKTDREIFPPAQSAKIEQHHRRVLDSGEAMTFEEHTEHADGIHTSLVTLFPLRDAQGAVYAIGGIATDITDRHAAEKYQRATFEHAPIGIVHTSLDGRFIEANPRACAILGYTRDELLSRSILELTHPADRAQATAFRKQLLAGQANDATTREKRYLRRDQSLIWAAVTLALVRKPDGAPEYFVAMIQDVSSRYIAEQQFRTTFEQATVGIVHSSLDGHYLLANQRFCDMLGYSLGEILGMRTRDVVHPEDRELDRTFRDKLLSGEINSYSGEKRYLRKNGAPIWVNRTISLARDEDGKPQYLIRVAEDITSRKEAEVRLEQTFEQAAVGIVRTDLERIIISVNRKFCEMTGYAREDLLGTNLRQISHPEDRGKDAPLRQRLLAGEVDHLQAERRYIRRDGSLIWVRRTTSLARDIANNQSHYIFVVEDITARRLAEDSYRATFDMAPIGIMHTGFDRRILDVNPKLCEILGYTRDELLTMTTAELLTPEYLESDRPHYMQQMIKGELQAFHSQRPYVRKDGSLVWTERSISLVRDRAGQPLYFLRMVEDISERKRVEDALAQERQLLRTVVDAIPDRIYVKDTEGRFILQNASNLKVRGVKNHDDIVGKTAFDVLPPELAKRVHEEDQAIIRSGQPMIDREGRTHFASTDQENGSTHWHLTSKVPLINAEGRVYGLVGVNRDITEQKHSAERIMRLNRFFSTISATNAAIVRARDRETLFASICHVVVREGGLGSACVRIHDPQTDELRVVAHDGTGRDYFSEMPVSALPGDPEGDGMGGRTFRENTLMVSNDMLNDPTLARWHQRAGRHGFGALATLPLSCNGKVIGIFSLQAKETGFFDCEVVKLLGEMAGDISFALANLDLQAQHQATLHALQASDEQFRQLASHIPQIFWITDARQQQTLYASPTYETVTGRPLRDLDANPKSWLEAIHDEDRQQVKNARKEKAPIGDYDIEYRLVHANGSVRWIHDRAFPVKNANGEVYRIAGIAEDITEAKLSREQLAHLAHFDSLTGLPNRVLFNDRLRQSIAQARRNSWILGVLFLDLDRFKLVNDTLGHATGDLLLKQVAARLSACLRPSDTIARLSGDEFAIILSELSSPQNASLVAQKILAALAEPFNLDGHEVFVTTSIGITIYPTDSHDIETLIRDADAAMYGAKSAGRNNYQYYTAAMNARAAEKLQLETQMRRALERREFVLHYQPKIDIPSGRIFGFEALLRWQSPEQGLVPPGEFIPMLEETGLIVPVGEWIAQAACAQVRAWQDAGIKPVPVAINLSARQLRQPGFSEVLKQALLTSRVEPELIQVEITESSLMDNPEEAIVVLQQLKALGILLAADDFGTGYSSLSYLKRFPLDALKIDRSFVRDITIDDDDAVIARTVITLAHSLGLKVVAEGVETEEQLAFLGENRCDEAQGFLFARPLPADACAALLAAGQPLHRARTPDADGRTPAVLIVDDDKDHLLLSRLLLQKDGHPVLTTTNSHDALEMLATQPVGIVISDQNMPEMNGVELLRRVKLMYPEIVRIMLSGVSDFNMATAAINEGEVHKFFVKGRDEELLRREIRLKIRQIPEKSRTFPNLPAARQGARY